MYASFCLLELEMFQAVNCTWFFCIDLPNKFHFYSPRPQSTSLNAPTSPRKSKYSSWCRARARAVRIPALEELFFSSWLMQEDSRVKKWLKTFFILDQLAWKHWTGYVWIRAPSYSCGSHGTALGFVRVILSVKSCASVDVLKCVGGYLFGTWCTGWRPD